MDDRTCVLRERRMKRTPWMFAPTRVAEPHTRHVLTFVDRKDVGNRAAASGSIVVLLHEHPEDPQRTSSPATSITISPVTESGPTLHPPILRKNSKPGRNVKRTSALPLGRYTPF